MSASTHGTTPYYYVPAESRHPVMAAAGLFFVILGAAGGSTDTNGRLGGSGLRCGGLFVLYQWFRDAARESEAGLYGRKIDLVPLEHGPGSSSRSDVFRRILHRSCGGREHSALHWAAWKTLCSGLTSRRYGGRAALVATASPAGIVSPSRLSALLAAAYDQHRAAAADVGRDADDCAPRIARSNQRGKTIAWMWITVRWAGSSCACRATGTTTSTATLNLSSRSSVWCVRFDLLHADRLRFPRGIGMFDAVVHHAAPAKGLHGR